MTGLLPRWVRWCGYGALAAALPSAIWRSVVGLGAPLGTPASWRAAEDIPGSGTTYVLGLSLVQALAALLTLVLVVPGADRIPYARGRRFPRWLVVGVSSVGALALAVICVLSVVNWSHVDPFRDAAGWSAGKVLCWACYGVALLWPVMLGFTIVGYGRSARTGPAVVDPSL